MTYSTRKTPNGCVNKVVAPDGTEVPFWDTDHPKTKAWLATVTETVVMTQPVGQKQPPAAPQPNLPGVLKALRLEEEVFNKLVTCTNSNALSVMLEALSTTNPDSRTFEILQKFLRIVNQSLLSPLTTAERARVNQILANCNVPVSI